MTAPTSFPNILRHNDHLDLIVGRQNDGSVALRCLREPRSDGLEVDTRELADRWVNSVMVKDGRVMDHG